MKIVYMGTPDFAVGALEALVKAGHEIVLVVTQPDKPKGRGKEIKMTPVKECALKHDIPVFQPVKIKEQDAVAELKKYPADVFVVAAFGQILSQEILDLPKYGCFNIHASLLPKYRGAAPIQWAVINGETESGVTIMKMDAGLDTGDMAAKTVVTLSETETGESLHDKLAKAGAELIVEMLPKIEEGTVCYEAQDNSKSSYAKMLTKSLGYIDWSKSAIEIERLVRGLNSWPSAYTYFKDKTCKIWEAKAVDQKENNQPGTIFAADKEIILINTGKGLLKVTSLQLEGKKRLSAKEFMLGHPCNAGMKFGK